MKRIGVCGHFGEGKNLLNGQTVKTKIFRDELIRQVGEDAVTTVDTHGWKSHPLKLAYQCFELVRKNRHIVILPAQRGIKIFVPLFLFINRFFQRKLHYVVIGGWLPQMLENEPKLKNRLQQFDSIHVETHSMIQILNELGLNNVEYMPNFKPLPILSPKELEMTFQPPYRLCTFSRVMPEKGIEDAIEAIKRVNAELGPVFTLDIYGQIEKGYEERFTRLQKNFPDAIAYRGLVNFDESINVLKTYFALLFPTFYEGEGFPGTAIDAFASGLPVIASDWKYNSEVIHNQKTGIIYGNGVEDLVRVLKRIYTDPDLIIQMKETCIREAGNYAPRPVVERFLSCIEKE